MADLQTILASVLVDRFNKNAARVRELAQPLTNEQFWQKPYSYGNSFGHLVLHLTGNLNYYVGSQIAKAGYVRDRPKEFNDPNPPAKEDALKRFDEAVEMVARTIKAQKAEDWSAPYQGDWSPPQTRPQTRLEMVVVCAAHMQHHIGQMIYLTEEWNRKG